MHTRKGIMKASQPFSIKPADCRARTVLASNFIKPKSTVMTKSGGLVVGTRPSLGLGIPAKSANGFAHISSVSLSPRPTYTQEDLSLGLDVSLNCNRKRRLDYLTFEEKLKRKKLKNRVAAQTSRDRKKARMDELEVEVKELQDKNNVLEQENFNLQIEKEKLAAENQKLREQLSNNRPTRTIASEKQAVGVGCSPLIIGPAVSVVDPPPKGRGLHPAPGLCDEQALWKILTFCILSQISLQTLETQTTLSTNLKNLQQVYFEKLMKTSNKSLYKQITRLLVEVENGSVPVKWWGRQQKTWNPVDD